MPVPEQNDQEEIDYLSGTNLYQKTLRSLAQDENVIDHKWDRNENQRPQDDVQHERLLCFYFFVEDGWGQEFS
jgi:hypothetical protein